MLYEWDEGKRVLNLIKHSVDFAEIEDFDWDTATIAPSPRRGEMRYSALGWIENRLHHVVYVERGEYVRIISLRKAGRRETRKYEYEA